MYQTNLFKKVRMNLTRPLAFFDLETTGTDISVDKIIEMAIVTLFPNGKVEKVSFLFNPGKPIPPEATEIHGISDEDVKDKPLFETMAQMIFEKYFKNVDLGGFNIIRFDVPMLSEEFSRSDISFPEFGTHFADACTLFHKFNPRNLSAAFQQYCGEELQNAHSAEADTEASLQVFLKQHEMHFNPETTLEEIHEEIAKDLVDFAGKLTRNKDGEIIYAFGKDKGLAVSKYPGFGQWMLRQTWITRNTADIVTREINNPSSSRKVEERNVPTPGEDICK